MLKQVARYQPKVFLHSKYALPIIKHTRPEIVSDRLMLDCSSQTYPQTVMCGNQRQVESCRLFAWLRAMIGDDLSRWFCAVIFIVAQLHQRRQANFVAVALIAQLLLLLSFKTHPSLHTNTTIHNHHKTYYL